MHKLTRTALAIDRDLLKKFDAWMAKRDYASRSEAMRDLIRATLVEAEWQNPRAEVVAVLSIIYDHAARDMAQEITHVQHEDHHVVLCSQHVHLDHDNCLEVILMQGPVKKVRKLADGIIATRGVRAGKLTLLSKNV